MLRVGASADRELAAGSVGSHDLSSTTGVRLVLHDPTMTKTALAERSQCVIIHTSGSSAPQ